MLFSAKVFGLKIAGITEQIFRIFRTGILIEASKEFCDFLDEQEIKPTRSTERKLYQEVFYVGRKRDAATL